MSTETTEMVLGARLHLPIHKVLIGLDFTELSERALAHAVTLATKVGCSLRIVHAEHPLEDRDAKASRHLAQNALDEAVERCRAAGVEATGMLRAGSATGLLRAEVEAWRPDLVYLGACGTPEQDRSKLGSTAQTLLRLLPCPVVILGPESRDDAAGAAEPHRILCPIELCDDAAHRLKLAGRFARLLGAEVVLVHVVDIVRESSRPHNATDIQFQLDRLAGELLGDGVVASAVLLYGDPGTTISSYAREIAATCIVFGLHKDGLVSTFFPRSLVAGVIRHAPCAVLSFPHARLSAQVRPRPMHLLSRFSPAAETATRAELDKSCCALFGSRRSGLNHGGMRWQPVPRSGREFRQLFGREYMDGDAADGDHAGFLQFAQGACHGFARGARELSQLVMGERHVETHLRAAAGRRAAPLQK